jgi:hypothetical protein
MIKVIVFLAAVSVTEISLAQTCPQSTHTINSYLANFQKAQSTTVVYAWTGAHYSGGAWADRKNGNDTITYDPSGGQVSQSWSSSYSHGANSDASSASASAQCTTLPSCTTANLSVSACVTSKVDSAGAGAYARAGTTVPPRSAAAKTGTLSISIPNRMTLTSNVGDESGVWGIAVSVEKSPGQKFLEDKGHPDVAPFLVNLLGLKNDKQFKVHADKKRSEMFVTGFELDPQGNSVKLIGPDGEGWKNMTAKEHEQILSVLQELKAHFTSVPCSMIIKEPKEIVSAACRAAEYLLGDSETKAIEIPVVLPEEPESSESYQTIYVEVGLGGRDVVQVPGSRGQNPSN